MIVGSWGSTKARVSWEDDDEGRIESKVTDIVVELIVDAERAYREGRQRHYEWLIDRKARLIEEIRKRKEEAEQRERERIIQLEKDQISKLVDDAVALRQAADIREYVTAVRERCEEERGVIPTEDIEEWSIWALGQADRIDPVLSRNFLRRTHDEGE